MSFRVLVTNNKGGVGKTTAAVSLWLAATYSGKSAVLVDLDRQANASRWAIGPKRLAGIPAHGGAEVLAVTKGHAEPNLFLRNSDGGDISQHMLDVERGGGGQVLPANAHMAPQAWADVRTDLVTADIVVLDTPPGLPWSVLSRLMFQADFIVCPTHAEAFAIDVLPDMVSLLVESGRSDMLDNGTFRVLLNAIQKNAGHRAWEAVLRKHHGGLLFDAVWPRAATFAGLSEQTAKVTQKTKPVVLATELWGEIFNATRGRAAA